MIKATRTLLGAERLAEALMHGKSLKITSFSVGNGGHGSDDLATTPSRSLTSLPNSVFTKSSGIVSYMKDSKQAIAVTLDVAEAVGYLSSLGIYATIVASPIESDATVGTEFLYAVAHFDKTTKQTNETVTYEILV